MDKGLPAILIMRPHMGGESVEWAGTFPLDEEWEDGEVELAGQPTASVLATESGSDGVRVTGQVLAKVRIRCRRCLVRRSSMLESTIDVRFEPDLDSCDEAPGLYRLDSRLERIDLLPALREELLLALPSYPVCKPDCCGLCKVCGTDLNVASCECRTETADPRWDVLREVAEGSPQADDDDKNQEG